MSAKHDKVECFCSWSGGKDSCLALYRAVAVGRQPRMLITMMCEDGDRSRSHGLSAMVLRSQADALGIPLATQATSWSTYEERFQEAIAHAQTAGLKVGVFGDIDIAEHRKWVERVCAAADVTPMLPLWQAPRESLLAELLELGFRAEIVAVKNGALAREFLGQVIDADIVRQFRSAGIDLAGENGEYHTVVTDGPLFRWPLRLAHGQQLLRDGYWFSDVAVRLPGLDRAVEVTT